MSCACGTWKPRRGSALVVVIVAGGQTVRNADRPWREKDDQEANAGSGNAAGNRDESISALLLIVAEQPAGYPVLSGRSRGADVVRWACEETDDDALNRWTNWTLRRLRLAW